MFYVFTSFELISALEHNSKLFQSVSLTPGELIDTLQKAKLKLKELSCAEAFQQILGKVEELGLSVSPSTKLCRKSASTLNNYLIYDKGG